MILFGDGVVAQVVLSGSTKGNYQSINWGWGIGVMFGVYISGGISGGHLNPCVTLANCVFRGFPFWKFPIYALSQTAGCFFGALIVYLNYYSAFDAYEGAGKRTVVGPTATAFVFSTYPASFLSTGRQFLSEVVGSAALMVCIFAICDQYNTPANDKGPLIILFLIFGIGACLGWQTGYAINMARDLGTRLLSYVIGYGNEVWSAGHYYFWVPIIAPFIGCLLGGFLYDLFIYIGVESPLNSPYFGIKRLSRMMFHSSLPQH
ncbi:hypothetical protein PNEG_02398 [Pneumocystis murina B123]|uniref:Aquaporin n=1 Tax=Pneumocystis murina (strain B123) TaxID=1069680 RepID=M7PG65_PNEMU|nr:hypothetical protein PNEG_02398 [Pneumocystis murina B123]EMR09454.1 hypothetical protein PNEG_02398 [Pneumocystis murina B123]